MAIQSNTLATLRQRLHQFSGSNPDSTGSVTPSALVVPPTPYVDNRTVTPYLAINLEGLTLSEGKDKVKLPRFAVFYSDTPGKIWIQTAHPDGSERLPADFEVYQFSPQGILSLNKGKLDNVKAQLIGGIAGDVLYRAMLAHYDVTFYVAGGYISLDCVLSVIDTASNHSSMRHSFAALLSENGFKPTDVANLGWVATAQDMRNPVYSTVPPDVEIKSAMPKQEKQPNTDVSTVPDTAPSLMDNTNELSASDAVIDTDVSTVTDTVPDTIAVTPIAPVKPVKPSKVPA